MDKKVPIAIVMSLLAQTAAVLWWGAKLDHRVEVTEQRIVEINTANRAQDAKADIIDAERRINLQRLSRTEQALTDIREFMTKVDSKLDRIVERR